MARQTTKAEQNSWLARCRYADCEETKVRCPECGKPGHVSPHILEHQYKQDYQVRITIQHAHFLENIDAGRNMFCETEYIQSVNADTDVRYRWTLDPLARKHLTEYYSRKLSK